MPWVISTSRILPGRGLAAVRHLWGTRIPDPGRHLGNGMPITENGEVEQALTNPRGKGCIIDGGQRLPVWVETGHRAMAHHNPSHAPAGGPRPAQADATRSVCGRFENQGAATTSVPGTMLMGLESWATVTWEGHRSLKAWDR